MFVILRYCLLFITDKTNTFWGQLMTFNFLHVLIYIVVVLAIVHLFFAC
jgi:hypothetical protein